MIDTLVHNINSIVTIEREEKNIPNNSFLLAYIESNVDPSFKAYKRYKCCLVKVIPALKTKETLIYFEKAGKVLTGNEAEFRKKVEEEFMLPILEFFRSDNFNIYVNNGEVTKTTIQ